MTASTYQQIWDWGMNFWSGAFGFDLTQSTSSGSGSRRASGPSGPTAQDIRNQYDVDELTNATTQLWRAWLVEEPTEARQIAQSYVDAVVSSMGEVNLDFETFVTNRIKNSTRHAQLYQNMPDGVSELQYIQPFVQAAASVMGGSNRDALSDVVGGGAALGASPSDFRGRLQRTSANQNSKGFITGLENQMRDVTGVLRG